MWWVILSVGNSWFVYRDVLKKKNKKKDKKNKLTLDWTSWFVLLFGKCTIRRVWKQSAVFKFWIVQKATNCSYCTLLLLDLIASSKIRWLRSQDNACILFTPGSSCSVVKWNLGEVKIKVMFVSGHCSDWLGNNPEFGSLFLIVAMYLLACLSTEGQLCLLYWKLFPLSPANSSNHWGHNIPLIVSV